MKLMEYSKPSTNTNYSIWEQLPAPEARYTSYLTRHFYDNTAKHLIKDTVRVMMNGLPINLEKVQELEVVLVEQLDKVDYDIANSLLVKAYLKKKYSKLIDSYKEDRASKLRSSDYYLKPFKHTDMAHRSFFMKVYAEDHDLPTLEEELFEGVPKWTVKRVRKVAEGRPVLSRLLAGGLSDTHPLVQRAMVSLAETKANMWNKSYFSQIQNPQVEPPKFNPGSPLQKAEIFEMIGIESTTLTSSGSPQWDRKQIERVNKETDDQDVKDFTQSLIDHSFAAIIQNNFIKAFYNYTIDGRLYGNLKLLGAKSARYTSNSPNMLQMPSTGSVFAKPVKECFIAPEGYVVGTIDFSALEDRVTANNTRDPVKLGIFTEGLDGHSVAATYYYEEKVKDLIGDFASTLEAHKEASKMFKALVDDKDKVAKGIRQDSKIPNFKLSYGGYPDEHKGGVVSQKLFDLYHYSLYPGVSAFREDYVIPTAEAEGQIHLGLGFSIKTDRAESDQRTLNNACSQFWSILTAVAINEIHLRIDEAGLQEEIQVTSSIYDSIYFIIKDDPYIIQWLNEQIVPIMEKDYMEDQTIPNEARLELGNDWSTLYELSDNASIEEISQVLDILHEA